MTLQKISEDTLLKDLFEALPESKDILMEYGYSKIVEFDVEDVVVDKLTLKGLLRLAGFGEKETVEVVRKIQALYNKKLEEMR